MSLFTQQSQRYSVAGMTTWPGANFVTFEDGGRWFLKYGDRRKIAADLKARPTFRR